MRSSGRDPLSAADDRPPAPRVPRGIAAASDRSRHLSRRAGNRMRSPLAESQRVALIEAMLPEVAFDGWSRPALRAAARRIGMPVGEAVALFPGGPGDYVARFSRWADTRMFERLENSPLDELRAPERTALAVGIRLGIVEPWREAVRRALTVLALP